MDLIDACERGLIPDPVARLGMRQLIARRLAEEFAHRGERRSERFNRFLDELRSSPIAIHTQDANQQHYEVPTEFFHAHLGPRMKYSCCYYPEGNETLAQAEDAMLALSADRAELADGMRILDLGCGWGSMSIWMAQHYPHAEIVALSNSYGQRRFIEHRADALQLTNLRVLTGNVAEVSFPLDGEPAGFDRIVSVEMFEHMKNYGALLAKLAGWLRPDGRLFVHVFAHRLLAYPFEDAGQGDWMSRYFFTGGTMPSEHLFAHFQDDLRIERQWWLSGKHYERTANQWLDGMDAAPRPVADALGACYGPADLARWTQRWRMFYMAVAELFGFAGGEEWGVAHYRFMRRR